MRTLLLSLLCLAATVCSATVTTVPTFIKKNYNGEVTIVFNPREGNKGMVNATQCYAHTGVTYNGTQWQKYGTWRDGLDKYRMTKNADGNWELRITPNIHAYYGVDAGVEITQLCFVFNDGPDGNLEGKTASGGDYFVDLYDSGLALVCNSPANDVMIEAGDSVAFSFTTSEEADFLLTTNGTEQGKGHGTTYEQTLTFPEKGTYTVTMTAATATDTSRCTRYVTVMAQTVCKPLPENIELGQNFDSGDPSRVTLCTFAAGNKRPNDPTELEPAKAVYVVGDFNGWKTTEEYQMYRDSCHFWLPVSVTPNVEHRYQYLVVRADGKQVYVSDAFAPVQYWKDNAYQSSLRTAQEPYKWDEATLNFKRPDKNNLVIYEMWVYDYTSKRNFAGVMERLDYIQQLGVNAIEFMPVCEFDGDYNWGYSPNHYFAVDTQYGTPDGFRQLIDSIHARGMAVIMDMVFNHATGNNPQNKLYPYGAELAYNPWFNVTAPHSDNVYEDWNHDFPETRKMFTRALKYWLTEYKVDGFRMDLSHGFCGKTNDAFDNICYYYDNAIRAVSDDAYFILEHWGSNMGSERPKLINRGMLCWHNINNAYSQMAMGYQTSDGIGEANRKGYVSYCESHDEERNYYKAKTYGKGIVKENETARLCRVPLTVALNVLLNGPKMMWQFEELGYDYSINSTRGSSAISGDNRTSIKEQPEKLGWFTDSLRMAQYDKVSKIVNLRTHVMPQLFEGSPKQSQLGSGKAVKYIWWQTDSLGLFVAGNTSADADLTVAIPDLNTDTDAAVSNPDTDTAATASQMVWYDYFTGRPMAADSLPIPAGGLLLLTAHPRHTPATPSTSIDVYPTYTSDYIYLSAPADVCLYDWSGALVMEKKNTAFINATPLRPGFYLLQMHTDTIPRQTVKVYKH